MNQQIKAFFQFRPQPIIQKLSVGNCSLQIDVLREDLMFPALSGNKFRKLKYHLLENDFKRCISFAGNHSNHLYALAEAVRLFGFEAVVFHPKTDYNTATLEFARSSGVHLIPLSYSDFRKRKQPNFIKSCRHKVGATYYIPEGGGGNEGVKGCEEILDHPNIKLKQYDAIAVACGTGTMLLGILNYLVRKQQRLQVIALSALKQKKHIQQLLDSNGMGNLSQFGLFLELAGEDEFGGFGKYNDSLIDFILLHYQQNDLELDHVYTAKLLWKLTHKPPDRSLKNILMVHSGGLQGRSGMQKLLKK